MRTGNELCILTPKRSKETFIFLVNSPRTTLRSSERILWAPHPEGTCLHMHYLISDLAALSTNEVAAGDVFGETFLSYSRKCGGTPSLLCFAIWTFIVIPRRILEFLVF